MLQLFQQNKDVHGFTAAKIMGIDYEEFARRKGENDPVIMSKERGTRKLGKIANLSCQYRTGVVKLRRIARTQYGVDATIGEVQLWYDSYHSGFVGVRRYWNSAIETAKSRGYAVTAAGRRFYIRGWENPDTSWKAESNAINHPIQGTGADMKELAIALIADKYPQLEFLWDMHDGLFYATDDPSNDMILEVRDMLDRIDYVKYWKWEPSVPLTWDASVGDNWGSLHEL